MNRRPTPDLAADLAGALRAGREFPPFWVIAFWRSPHAERIIALLDMADGDPYADPGPYTAEHEAEAERLLSEVDWSDTGGWGAR